MEKLLLQMTNDLNKNIKLINKEDCVLYDGKTFLHLLVDKKYNEENCFLAIKSLLKGGVNVNKKDDFGYNFIQTALYTGYSEKFILNIINESLKYNLNVNHVDDDKDTIMHTAIYSDGYKGEINNIYNLLCNNGFNSLQEDKEGRNLVEAMIYQKYPSSKVKEFKKVFVQQITEKSDEKKKSKFKILRRK